MSTCPFCDQLLEDDQAEECPTCGQDLLPPELHPYDVALETLDDAIGKVTAGQVPPNMVPMLFSHLLGSVQQVLDHCREDLADNLRRIQTANLDLPPEALKEPMEFIQRFERLQNVVGEHMDTLSDIFSNSSTATEFNAQRERLEYAMAALRSAFHDLEDLERSTSDPQFAVVNDDPLPDEVSTAIHQFELAMGALGRYCDEREKAWLEKSLLHLDEARGRLKQHLMVETFDWG